MPRAQTVKAARSQNEETIERLEEQARAVAGGWWETHHDGYFIPAGALWVLPDNATVIDWAYALDPFQAKHLAKAKVNGKTVPLTHRLKPEDRVQLFTSEESVPQMAWIEAAGTPARDLIRYQLGMLADYDAGREVVETAFHNIVHPQPEKQRLFPFRVAEDPAKGKQGYVQPGREGKKLIGAYVPVDDITRFKALLKARGTNVQDFFAQIVANELAAAQSPQELERLMEAQLDRFRATLRQTLPKLKR